MKRIILTLTFAALTAANSQAGGLDGVAVGFGIANTLINAAAAARQPTTVVERTVVVRDHAPAPKHHAPVPKHHAPAHAKTKAATPAPAPKVDAHHGVVNVD